MYMFCEVNLHVNVQNCCNKSILRAYTVDIQHRRQDIQCRNTICISSMHTHTHTHTHTHMYRLYIHVHVLNTRINRQHTYMYNTPSEEVLLHHSVHTSRHCAKEPIPYKKNQHSATSHTKVHFIRVNHNQDRQKPPVVYMYLP